MTALLHTTRIALTALLLALPPATAAEVQSHGLWFEHWLCDTFFDGYRPASHTQKWDIPAAANARHGSLPVNPKAVKYGTPLGLGDALRQHEIGASGESFILIAGFWEQSGETVKKWVNAQAVTVTPEQWRKLWHPVTLDDLKKLDAIIKDTTLTLEEARAQAKTVKSRPPFTAAVIQVNPKIDHAQRRLQCSLGFHAFFDHLAPQAARDRQDSPAIWEKPIPPVPHSAPRRLQK